MTKTTATHFTYFHIILPIFVLQVIRGFAQRFEPPMEAENLRRTKSTRFPKPAFSNLLSYQVCLSAFKAEGFVRWRIKDDGDLEEAIVFLLFFFAIPFGSGNCFQGNKGIV